LEDYVKNRDICLYVDAFRQRIGGKLAAGKIGPDDFQKAIQDVQADQ
jgi:hypothetical protein